MRRDEPAFARRMWLADDAPDAGHPFDLPAVATLATIELAPVTFFAGDNGSGKSTVIEALAVAAGFNPEGGGRNLRFTTFATHSSLAEHLVVQWERQPRWGWFLRAETFYGMASHIKTDDDPLEGIRKMFPELHDVSHGESFLTLIDSRFGDPGLYLMDEPESALSFESQLRLLRLVHDGARRGSQFVIATHSPVLLRLPGARIYRFGDGGIESCEYDELPLVNVWRRFLDDPDPMLRILLADEEGD